MILAFLLGIVAYIGLIRFQTRLFRLGKLTEAIFVLFQVAILGLLLSLGSVTFLLTEKGKLIGIGVTCPPKTGPV